MTRTQWIEILLIHFNTMEFSKGTFQSKEKIFLTENITKAQFLIFSVLFLSHNVAQCRTMPTQLKGVNL